ncbi:four-carbon acid sugar kinase family protein [Puniceibacterium sp. IMCC21224]|uniref:four-carbon acid sugar kinase family protein n=1 Tax=Puniceibacterium sp. IMCC21224 TaxID=1618204 RepID=UPI001E4E9CB0|nr:four-carbon acid sugar kinase family protein [Puniceibacterium sp. IMCC21224]
MQTEIFGQGAPGESPILAWLGDDFTGAAAVMEALAFAGLPSVLFLSPPDAERLAAFPGVRGIGIASLARTYSPAWMDQHLPPLFDTLAATGAGLVQYKVCSTLDSAPHIGSIGRAMEIGAARFGGAVPVLVAAPQMRRYQAFGQLFAGTDAGVFRLDRHPVMARHPVTPMGEADVARHLAAQTGMALTCLDLERLADAKLAAAALVPGQGVTIDQMSAADQVAAGRLLWEHRETNRFVVGSQGTAYALVAYFRAQGLLPPESPVPGIGRARGMAVVSGSVSPVAADQIAWACANGFEGITLDATAACGDGLLAAEGATIAAGLDALDRGQVPLIYTAAGPDDPAVARLRAAAGDRLTAVNERIGRALGRILGALIERGGLDRAVVSGGDTSGHVCQVLGIDALTALAPTIPGAAICRAHARGSMDGLALALKGGQMGSIDYFGWVLDGGGAR